MMRFFLASGALFALVGVVSRALSSHALIDRLTASGKLDQFNLASDYILIHGLALIAVALLLQAAPCRPATLAGCCFFVGGLLFPVTVFIKCFAPMGTSGILTPIGGGILMLGWLLLACAALVTRFA